MQYRTVSSRDETKLLMAKNTIRVRQIFDLKFYNLSDDESFKLTLFHELKSKSRSLLENFSGIEQCRWEMRMVRTVGKMLCFKT